MLVELPAAALEYARRMEAFCREEVAPHAAALDAEERHPAEQVRRLGELGFMGLLTPKRYGGSEAGNVVLSAVMQEIARHCPSTAVVFSAHNSLVQGPILKFGGDETKERYLPRLASGEWLGAYSLTESHSGSDAAALRCRASASGGAYALRGAKVFVTNGKEADLVIVFVRTAEDQRPSRGITCLAVEKRSPGFAVGKCEKKLGIRGSHCVELIFDDCRVPAANRLGEENQGFKIALETLDGGRIGIASQSLGIARACLDECVARLASGSEGGVRRAEKQSLTFRVAELYARYEAARLLTFQAAEARDLRVPHTREAAMAKLLASQLANDAARAAIDVFGPAGATSSASAARRFRDARITELYEGTTEIQKLVIFRELLRGLQLP